MSLVDDFDLNNYETINDSLEAHRSIRNEISILNGYLRGIAETRRPVSCRSRGG